MRFDLFPFYPAFCRHHAKMARSSKAQLNIYAYFMHIISIYIFTFAVIGTIIALLATLCGVFLFMKGVVGYE